MENGGEKPKSTTKTTTTTPTTPNSNHQRTTSKRGPVPGPQYHHKHLLPLIPLVLSSSSVIKSFISENDLSLLPSQTLTLESKLSSIALSINRLKSVIEKQQQQNPNCTPKTLKSTKSTQSKNIKSPKSTPLVPEFTTPPPQSPTPPSELQSHVFVESLSSCWFQRFLSDASDQSDPRWIEAFRMTKTTFILLLQTLAPSLQNSKIPPDYMLASAIFRLAHGVSFKSVATRFGIDVQATIRAFYEVIRAINDRLGHFFEFSPNDLSRIIVGFGWISLPNCCGVLGYSRFGFELGGNSGGDDAVLVQCLVDSEGRFLDVSAGWPSSMNPSAILKHSKLYTRVQESKDFLNGPTFDFRDGSSIPQYILGDSCSPLLPWLLTPIPMVNDDGGVNGGENSSRSLAQVYNSVHKRGMKLVDTAFRTVRARWRLLSTKWKEESIEPYPYVIVAGCLLHNFLLNCSEQLPNEFMGEYDTEPEQFPVFEGKNDEDAQRIRYTLALQLVMASQSV